MEAKPIRWMDKRCNKDSLTFDNGAWNTWKDILKTLYLMSHTTEHNLQLAKTKKKRTINKSCLVNYKKLNFYIHYQIT